MTSLIVALAWVITAPSWSLHLVQAGPSFVQKADGTVPAGAITGLAQPKLDVEAIAVPQRLAYEVSSAGTEGKGVLEPAPGRVLIGVRVVFREKGELSQVRTDSAAIKDATGSVYVPLGLAPVKIENLIPFKVITQFEGGLFSEGSPEAGSSYMVSRMRGALEFSRQGSTGTSFILIYEVPSDQRQFTLALPGNPGLTVALK